MEEANHIVDLIKSAKNIVITSHKSPDGDSIGSSMSMYHFIEALGAKSNICHPDECPDYIEWAKGDIDILNYESNQDEVDELMLQADLIFCLDYNGANRLGKDMGELLTKCSGTKVMIDHHPFPKEFVDVAVSVPSVCSTCQLVYELIDSSGNINLLNQSIATPLYLGIVTDTGSFRFSSVNSRTHEIAAKLIETGINHTDIHEDTFGNVRLEGLKLRGFATSERLELIPDFGIAYIYLREKDLERFDYIKGDTEGLVNIALGVQGVMAAAFFAEKDGAVKISFRSKKDVAVNKLSAENFEGGGHTNAAGGISYLSMDETISKFRSLIPKYFKSVGA